MDEEEKKEAERKAAEEAKTKTPVSGTDDTKDGSPAEGKKQVETTPLIDVANSVAERIEKGNQKTAELLDRQEALEQRRALGGGTEAGQAPEKPKKMTDTEYAEALERGEVNPLKDDKLI